MVRWNIPAINLKGLDFLFLLSILFGFHPVHRLLIVKEEGEAEEGVVLDQFMTEVRKAVRNVSNVAGLR
jgi:hypothetical protein